LPAPQLLIKELSESVFVEFEENTRAVIRAPRMASGVEYAVGFRSQVRV